MSQIGLRGLVFSFEDPYLTNVYVIIGDKRIFVCDTFCGPESMKAVTDHLQGQGHKDLPFTIFNSHSHYDHIWGNSFFENAQILSHHKCPELIEKEGSRALLDYATHMKGDVQLVSPNTTFGYRVTFTEEEVEFFHSPGHTPDSASCYDHKDRVLFVSDNVESPLPYLYQANLHRYQETLKRYLDIDWNFLVTGHDPISKDDSLIRENLEYISKLNDWTLPLKDLSTKAHQQHFHNILFLGNQLENLSGAAVAHFEDAIDYLASLDETAHSLDLQKQLTSVIRKK
ncbi:MAG: MBL fold metallo-hydrolase [Candidatus Thorarchaeota archaeon]